MPAECSCLHPRVQLDVFAPHNKRSLLPWLNKVKTCFLVRHHLLLKCPFLPGLDVCSMYEVPPLHIYPWILSILAACRPSSFMPSFTHSLQVFLPLNFTPATYTGTQSTTLICTMCPNMSIWLTTSATLDLNTPKLYKSSVFYILQWHPTHPSDHHMLSQSPNYADFQQSLVH